MFETVKNFLAVIGAVCVFCSIWIGCAMLIFMWRKETQLDADHSKADTAETGPLKE